MLQRDGRLFAHSLKSIFILLILLLVICLGAAAFLTASETEDSAAIEIAVCNLDSDSTLGSLAISFIGTQDLISSLIEIVYYPEEEAAVQAVRDGAAAAIIIPEDFFSGALQGDCPPCQLVLSSEGESVRLAVVSYVSAAGDLLTASQEAIFTGDYYLADLGADSAAAESINLYMNLTLFREIESAQELYLRTVKLDYTGNGLGAAAHYVALYLAFLLSLLTLGCARLYQSDMERGTLSLLGSVGIRAGEFLRWKVLLPFGFLLILLAVFCGVIARFPDLPLVLSASSLLSAAAALGLTALWGALFGIGLGETAGAVLFTVQAAGLFFCGGIIPYAKLVPAALAAGSLTPLGCLYRLLAPLFGGSCDLSVLVPAAVYSLAGVLLYLRRRTILLTGREAA